jgi:hypothetical protein
VLDYDPQYRSGDAGMVVWKIAAGDEEEIP